MKFSVPLLTIAASVVAWALYFIEPFVAGDIFTFFLGLSLIGVVIAGVLHAEVVAHRTGEPYGTLLLAIAVMIIDVSLIICSLIYFYFFFKSPAFNSFPGA